jgi:predicted alpha/beta-hydrolase family hydrolase
VVAHLRGGGLRDLPLVAGGRSSGARVACRTAAETGALGVLCLAFPLHAPGRPQSTRQSELDAVAVPTLVIQGAGDPFGMPPEAPGRTVVVVAGSHTPTGDLEAVAGAAGRWLGALVDSSDRSPATSR